MARKLIMGVGNDIRGDDAVGELVAREFEKPGWETVDCGSVPENHIIMVEEGEYDLVLIIDAASMGLEPGEIRVVPREYLGVFTMSTHALPLSLVMDYLEDKVEKVVLIGIQPEDMSLKEGITEKVEDAKNRLLEILKKGTWDKIPKLKKKEN
ncbi:MAG: hydrogenase maturation peptidase HycI [Candidatus Saliniplasma sp.]